MQTAASFPSRDEAAVPFIKEAGGGDARVILDALEKNILFLPGIETRIFGRPAPSQPSFRLKIFKISSLCVHAGAAETNFSDTTLFHHV
jgi:hypothetical protein